MLQNKEENMDAWYHEVIREAELVDFSPVKGCSVFREYCYEIWEAIRSELDKELRKLGFANYYFPTFIPSDIMKLQKQHHEVFSKEMVRVTAPQADLFIRPTSEMVIYPTVKNWIKTAEDLPLKINQYCSVVRWESVKPNLPLIRDNEFLWQESHSLHQTERQADKMVVDTLEIYRHLIEDILLISVFSGIKPGHRMFPGAKTTFALESIMPNIKSVQMATSHALGQNFSEPLGIMFQENGEQKAVWQACSGVTTRLIGALVMAHGDNDGLIIPPRIAPIQIALQGVDNDIEKRLKKFRTRRGIKKPVVKGIPLILSQEGETLILQRRDTLEKTPIQKEELVPTVRKLLSQIEKSLKKKSFGVNKKMASPKTFEEFSSAALQSFLSAPWCGENECAKEIKKETKKSIRVVNTLASPMQCIRCGKEAKWSAVFAEAY